MWESWGEGEKRTCGVPAVPPAERLDAHLSAASIFTIASGDLPDMTKLFVFAQAAPGSVGGTFLAGESQKTRARAHTCACGGVHTRTQTRSRAHCHNQ